MRSLLTDCRGISRVPSISPSERLSKLQIMLWGGPVATVRSRVFFVNYPVSFSLRYLYIRPISRHVCLSVCRSQGVVA